MSLQRRRTARSVQADLLPARLSLELPGRAENPGHVILGISAAGDAGMVATLAGEWLANVFGQGFTEDRNGECILSIEAFYDALSHRIGDRAFVGAIGLDEISITHAASRPATSSSPAKRLELADEGDPIRLHVQGIAHALLNRASGRALVTFDHLPGALELVGRPAPPRQRRSDAQTASAEAIAWYGFGTVTRHSRMRGGISHGVVEVRSGPAAVVSAR